MRRVMPAPGMRPASVGPGGPRPPGRPCGRLAGFRPPAGTAARRTPRASGWSRTARRSWPSTAASAQPARGSPPRRARIAGHDLVLQQPVQVLGVGPVLGALVGASRARRWPSRCRRVQPSSHQPSSTEQLTTPFMAAFMPLVPDASSGRRGLLSQTSTPWTRKRPIAHVVVLEDEHPAPNSGERLRLKMSWITRWPGRSAGWALPAKTIWTGRSASHSRRASRSSSVKSSAARL